MSYEITDSRVKGGMYIKDNEIGFIYRDEVKSDASTATEILYDHYLGVYIFNVTRFPEAASGNNASIPIAPSFVYEEGPVAPNSSRGLYPAFRDAGYEYTLMSALRPKAGSGLWFPLSCGFSYLETEEFSIEKYKNEAIVTVYDDWMKENPTVSLFRYIEVPLNKSQNGNTNDTTEWVAVERLDLLEKLSPCSTIVYPENRFVIVYASDSRSVYIVRYGQP